MEPKLMPVSHYGMQPMDKNSKLRKVSAGVMDMDDNTNFNASALKYK